MTTRIQDGPQVNENVHDAAKGFANALAETPEYVAFEMAARQYRLDKPAQRLMAAYQDKQRSLDMLIRLNAASDAERAELQRLYQAVVSQPSVAAYARAEAAFKAVCRNAAEMLSQGIGLDYASACSAGCCG